MHIFRKMAMNNNQMEISHRVVLVGNSLTGKTSLLASLLSDQLPANDLSLPSKTIRVHNQMVNENDFLRHFSYIIYFKVNLSLIDTSGAKEYERLRPLSYVDTSLSLICFSIDEPESILHVFATWGPEIAHFTGRNPVILVACKIDLRDDPETISKLEQRGEKPIKTKTGKKLASKIHADAYIECSAKTRVGVEELLRTAAQLVLKKTHHTR